MTQRILPLQQRTRVGFTFLELMIVLALLTGVIGMAAPAVLGWMNARGVSNAADSVAGTLLQTSSDAMWMGLPHAFEYSPEHNAYRSVTVSEKSQTDSAMRSFDENSDWKSLPDSLTLRSEDSRDNSPQYFKIVFDINGLSDCSGLSIVSPNMRQKIHIDPVSGLPSRTTE